MTRTKARARPTLAIAICTSTLSLVAASPTFAQVAPSPKTPFLIAAANGNPQWASTAAYIGSLCPNLTPGTDLRLRCAAALGASVATPPLATTALHQITPQQVLAQSGVVDGAIMPATSAVASRLSAIGHIGIGGPLASNNYRPIALASAGDTAGLGGASAARLQGYVNIVGGSGNRDTTPIDDGYSFDQKSITGGVDYRFSNMFTGGVSLSWGDTRLSFDANQGKMKSTSTVGTVYGLWTVSDRIQVSGLLAYGKIDYSSDRYINYAEDAASNISRIAHGDTKGDQWEGTVTANYAMPATDGWAYGPSLSISARKLDLDAFAETGAAGLNLNFDSQSTNSLQVALGFDLSKAISTQTGVISPYARVQGIYETKDNRRNIIVHYVDDHTGFFPGIRLTTDSPDRLRFQGAVGVSGQFANGWSGFADVETVVGLRNVSGYTGTLGLRKEF
jgi:uncharacterized protein YhjY with autotransporter beta-barrel domain